MRMANHGAEFRAVEASGIPSEVLLFLATSGVGQLKPPVWKFHKGEKGYGLSLFWRTSTGEQSPGTLNNANGSPQQRRPNGSSKRKQRSQMRMQEFLQRKRAEVGQQRPDAGSTGTPEVSVASHGRCELPISLAKTLLQQSHHHCSSAGTLVSPPTTPAPMDLSGTPVSHPTTTAPTRTVVSPPTTPAPTDLSGTPVSHPTTTTAPTRTVVSPPTTPARTDLTGIPVGPFPTPASTDLIGNPVSPPTTSAPDLSGTPVINLSTCESVMYEMRDDIPGVTFTRGGYTDWTPVRKSDLDKATGHHEGNGTSTAPRRAAMKKLQTKYAKEVAYREISGTPGLLLRRGNTRHSYEWLPIVPSPIASRTRNRTDFKTS